MKFVIFPRAPFNFDLITSLYSRFPTQSVDLYENGVYKRVLRLGEEVCLAAVSSEGTIEKPRLEVEVKPQSSVSENLVKDKIGWILGVEDNLHPFYEMGQEDEKLASVIKTLFGLRAPRTPTVFEALIIAITEQQIALPVALKLRKKLVEKYEKPTKVDGREYYLFPGPESLAGAKPEEIRELGLSSRKAEYIIGVAQKVAGEKIDLEKMRDWGKKKILETLTEIRGIGPWTVEYMMCRGMGRYEALPANDLALRQSLTQFLNRKERVTEKETREFLERFGQYRGYAAFYLIYTYALQKYPQKKLL